MHQVNNMVPDDIANASFCKSINFSLYEAHKFCPYQGHVTFLWVRVTLSYRHFTLGLIIKLDISILLHMQCHSQNPDDLK